MYEHWDGVNTAPSLRRTDMGSGDFAIETKFEFTNPPTGGYQFGLAVGFSETDRLWLGVNEDGTLNLNRIGADNHDIVLAALPVFLRIEKNGTEYTFLYKQNANETWTTLTTYTASESVNFVGFQGRTYAADDAVTFTVDYFRLERTSTIGGGEWTPPAPLPTIEPEPVDTSMTIDYTYDALHRLTNANYSTGDSYQYTYDAVGNRLSQESTISGQSSVISYQYDAANRLVDVNGVAYTWDMNGNLLSDGVNTYTYDYANRLAEVSNQSSVSSYQYNGLGDRISQTVNGVTTNYTLDLNTGLTQVLSDGTTDYLYGNGRIAQVSTTAEYFLGDALGSVRQMTDANGEVAFARGYDPYGVVTYTTGTSHTEFGFTGEQYSASTELLYLRARYYNPADGRFQSRDTWSGDVKRPLSLNRWGYVEGNPVNYIDPTGHISEGQQAQKADIVVEKLKLYNVHIVKDWGFQLIPDPKPSRHSPTTFQCEWQEGNWRNTRELEWTFNGVREMAKKLGGVDKFKMALAGKPIKFVRMVEDKHPSGAAAWTVLDVKIYNDTYYHSELSAGAVIVHELAHVWDTRQTPIFRLSKDMNSRTKSFDIYCKNDFDPSCYKFNNRGELPPTPYGATGPREDFADSFAICVYPNFKGVPSLDNYPIRKDYIEGLINGSKCSK